MINSLIRLYEKCIYDAPKTTLVVISILVALVAWHCSKFEFDASADTLLLENDKDLDYYRSIKARYGSDDFLLITYTPYGEMFNDAILSDIQSLRNDLMSLENVESVISILDVPLIESPRVSLKELSKEIRTLETPDIDKGLAKKELTTSPIYSDQLISKDGKTTAILVTLVTDKNYHDLLKAQAALREKKLLGPLSVEDNTKLLSLGKEIKEYRYFLRDQQHADIAEVRKVMKKYGKKANLFLGGVPMITSDSIDYIRNDVMIFGAVVFVLLILILATIFTSLRWVVMPLMTCVLTGFWMIGWLGWVDWPVTVVSSNFLPLLLIITLSLAVHLIVRYREFQSEQPGLDQRTLVREMVRKKMMPCLYTALTTMVAFGSLLVSHIQPLIDFGLMMTLGIMASFIFAFTFFPASLMLLQPSKEQNGQRKNTQEVTLFFADIIQNHGNKILLGFSALAILSVVGITFLSVENRFIDYYKKSTEIYQGMETIDNKLGGTTPLDVIIDAPSAFMVKQDPLAEDDMEAFDFGEDASDTAGLTNTSYWFNVAKLKQIHAMHDYLENLPETGKVMSVSSTMKMLRVLDEKSEQNNMYLSILYAAVPDHLKDSLFHPYLSKDGNQLRFSIRVFESDFELHRDELLNKIRSELITKFNLEESQVHLSGMLVLYNNMLQSFFKSQIMTLGIVFIAIFLMFIFSFRNIKVACLAIVPNLVAGLFVLGLMGWFDIPLDLMTISIAAICIGIAVDDTIHYVHRFSVEFQKDRNYWLAVRRSHRSIGLAMFYTTVIITLGFSVLMFSNFVPTIYFGLLTGCSMLIALIADLTLLPLLLVKFSPYGIGNDELPTPKNEPEDFTVKKLKVDSLHQPIPNPQITRHK